MIPQNIIDEIEARADIVELISSYIPLKKAGRNFKARCPFHTEKTASFIVSPQKQIFHCFGCGIGGGSIQFLMHYEKVSFPEAVEILAKRLSINIPKKRNPADVFKTTLWEINQKSAEFFRYNLWKTNEGKTALSYLLKRGIKENTAKDFLLGYAPKGPAAFIDYMRRKKISLAALEKAGLISNRSQGGYLDMFREKIIIPILDIRSRVIGFGARKIKENDPSPKYINTVENPVYSKRLSLFGINMAKEHIIREGFCIIVEGYLDILIPWQEGIKNIVASSGTALTSEQVNLLKRYTNNIIVAYDGDSAGQNASLRAIDIALENGLNIKVASLPLGYDPADLVKEKGREEFIKVLNSAKDFFDYKIEAMKKNYNINDIMSKSKIAKEMLLSINKISGSVVKSEYVKNLAQTLDIEEEALKTEIKKLSRPQSRYRENTKQEISTEPIPLYQKNIIQFMLSDKETFLWLKDTLDNEDFSTPQGRKFISEAKKFAGRHEDFSLKKFISSLEDENLIDTITKLSLEPFEEKEEALQGCLLKVQQAREKKIKENLKKEIAKAEENADTELLNNLMVRYNQLIKHTIYEREYEKKSIRT